MFGVSRKNRPTGIRKVASPSPSSSPSPDRVQGKKSIDDFEKGPADIDDGDNRARRKDSIGRKRRKDKHSKHSSKHSKDKKKSKKSEKKIGSVGMLSFDPDDGNNSDGVVFDGDKKEKSRKRKKHSSGLGFGGASLPIDPDESSSDNADLDGRRQQDENLSADDGQQTKSLYDKEALDKLKKEQKMAQGSLLDSSKTGDKHSEGSVAEYEKEGVADADATKDAIDFAFDRSRSNRKHPNKTDMACDEEAGNEEEFIPLDAPIQSSSKDQDPMVLTGDEAMAFTDQGNDDASFDHGLDPTKPNAAQKDEKKEQNQEMEEDYRKWEDTMARRAGVLPPTASTATTSSRGAKNIIDTETNLSSLSELKSTMQSSITHLQTIASDLEPTASRNESKIAAINEEIIQHQNSLETHGKAFEYYQSLRENLATWLGALRELNTMVGLVEEGSRGWEAEVSWVMVERRFEWSRDAGDVLQRGGLLQRIVGGHESLPVEGSGERKEDTPIVDEFGRDLSSMTSLAGTKRWNRRKKNSSIRRKDEKNETNTSLLQRINYTNEDNINMEEIQDWLQRREALSEAVHLIPTAVTDEYLSIANLCSLFWQWEQTYPNDFQQSYAEESLIQMLSVLVRLELVERWDIIGLCETMTEKVSKSNKLTMKEETHHEKEGSAASSKNYNELSNFDWFIDTKSAQSKRNQKNNTDDSAIIQSKATSENPMGKKESVLLRVILKIILPRFKSVFAFEGPRDEIHGIYDLFSTQQTKRLSLFFESLLEYLLQQPEEVVKKHLEELASEILTSLLSLAKFFLEEMPVPIVNTSNAMLANGFFLSKDHKHEFDDETSDAIAYATVIQSKDLSTLVSNILRHWFPIFRRVIHIDHDNISHLVQFILTDIVADRFLPAVQTLQALASNGSGKGDDHECFSMAKEIVCDVVDTVKEAGLFNKLHWEMYSAPLRVAVRTMGLEA